MKRKLFLLLLLITISSVCVLVFTACNKSEPPNSTRDPEVRLKKDSLKLVLGQCLSEAEFNFESDTPGQLYFADPMFCPQTTGVYECAWMFKPDDTRTFNTVSGTTQVEYFNYKVSFEENGGFEVEDIFFNETYTIDVKPLTAKNEYNFRGWLLDQEDECKKYVNFPLTLTTNEILYADYLFHSAEYLVYAHGYISYLGNEDSAAIWPINLDNNGNVLQKPEDIIGEVVIADMMFDMFVEHVSGFTDSVNMTSIILSNYTTTILGNTFGRCELESIFLPRYVSSIGELAFQTIMSLKTITFEDPDREVEIKEGAFFWCTALKDFTLPNTKLLPYDLFYGCMSLERITVPENVETIQAGVFTWCPSLKEIIFAGNKVKSIEKIAFQGCTALTSIRIPPSADVHYSAFYDCKNLKKIEMTESQIVGMAKTFHEEYIGDSSSFNVVCDVDSGYNGVYGNYVAGSEQIYLRYSYFSIEAVYVLMYEAYHHYQDVAMHGIGNETLKTLCKPPANEQLEAWKKPPVSPEDDPLAYWNHPIEVSARDFAKEQTNIEKPPPIH